MRRSPRRRRRAPRAPRRPRRRPPPPATSPPPPPSRRRGTGQRGTGPEANPTPIPELFPGTPRFPNSMTQMRSSFCQMRMYGNPLVPLQCPGRGFPTGRPHRGPAARRAPPAPGPRAPGNPPMRHTGALAPKPIGWNPADHHRFCIPRPPSPPPLRVRGPSTAQNGEQGPPNIPTATGPRLRGVLRGPRSPPRRSPGRRLGDRPAPLRGTRGPIGSLGDVLEGGGGG